MAISLIKYIQSDLYRYSEDVSFKSFIKHILLTPGFNYLFWFRITSKFRNPITRFILRKKMIKYGIEIYEGTDIGCGLYIGHWGGVVVNPNVVIGENCNISHGVTMGEIKTGDKSGTPVIGSKVYIAPGAKILGGIKLGDGSAVGANSVVISDVPEGVTVAGMPSCIISQRGSVDYINRTI